MNSLYSKAAASPMICRRIAATVTTTTTSSLLSQGGRRHAAHISKVAARAQEIQGAAMAAASSTTGSVGRPNGPGTPGSADRLMAQILADKVKELGRELTPGEKKKYELRLLKMKMSRKQYMKWLKKHPMNPVDIPNEKLKVPEGHGENIWLWNHVDAGHVVYSMHPQMDSNKALAQFPYTGKKLVPAKLRRDYWRPFAQIRFPAGQGDVGRSVWQKLLELKKRHELEWGEQKQDFLRMSREDRGRALNDQRANVIADIAAVLGGLGKGNKIWLETKNKGEEPTRTLCQAEVYWTNALDRHNAAEWSGNVRHYVGLPVKVKEPVPLEFLHAKTVEEKAEENVATKAEDEKKGAVAV